MMLDLRQGTELLLWSNRPTLVHMNGSQYGSLGMILQIKLLLFHLLTFSIRPTKLFNGPTTSTSLFNIDTRHILPSSVQLIVMCNKR